jgi:hypothetical protein
MRHAEPRADVAQLVERVLGKDEVTSSILVIGSRLLRDGKWGHCKWDQGKGGGSNSVVESQPSKLLVAGSIPVSRSRVSEADGEFGQVAEWLMAADCKSARLSTYEGSNPSLSTRHFDF